MAGKKKRDDPSPAEKKLRRAEAEVERLTAQVAGLRKRVVTLESEADMWRKRAKKHKSRVQSVTEKAEKAIADATALAKKRARAKADKKIRQVIADHSRDVRPRAEPLVLRDAPELPDASWTVARLRAAAREQGVAGYSRMRKEQLLGALV